MSLANLKKHSQSVKPKHVTVDEFIDDALSYQQGSPNIIAFKPQTLMAVPNPEDKPQAVLRRATFTLGDSTIEKLDQLATKSGIAKSRLIRIWVDMFKDSELTHYQSSQIK